MAQWRWCPAWATQTAGFLRQGSRDIYNYKAHPSHSIEYCPPCCFFAIPIFTRKWKKNQIHAFTSIIPASPVVVQNAKNHSTSAWGWRSACRFPQKHSLQYALVVLHSSNGWLATARADTSSGYCCAVAFAWGVHSSAQLQTQMGFGFAEKPVFLPSAGLSPCRHKKWNSAEFAETLYFCAAQLKPSI